ncbi:MAG: hypothetical protein B9J98_07655 [Candidatus Terraquivivens tikiterensis]|uniref:PIN domain-containing protein n=1 Tax=Candidatus Terraquivivens tikiterensis TaxID=1980982 RepID=A0A2R7Y0R0_9ARCH|nr:MAG: hypothetical protein B9J98_07655 [Candidatus Terraquivivens tikiterensis]
MSVQSVYLDTSAIVKRYILEEGSDKIDELYREVHAGKTKLAFSVWNIGEVAVVLDKYEKRGIVKNAKAIFEKFLGETRLLTKLGQLKLIPLNFRVLIQAIGYVFKHGIYIADAIQIASAKDFEGFISYDRELARIASMEGLKVDV